MGRLKKLCPILIPALASIIIIVLFQSVFLLGYVPTASMEPTLKTGSLLLGLRLFDELETGDIIIFHHDGSCLVKRIAACEGDTLIHKDEDDHFPAINIYWDHDGGKASELLCFAEYNSERNEGAQVCIGTYVSDEDETQYYAPYMAERNKEP